MKKILPVILSLGLLGLVVQFFVIVFTKSHECQYDLVGGNNEYMIYEQYQKKNDDHLYTFKVTDKNKDTYSFSYNHDFNKQENIITDIKYFEEDKLKCIYPIFKNNNTADIYCILNNKSVSRSYLEQINNKSIDNFKQQLIKQKYTFKKNSTKTTDIKNIKFYNDNIPDDIIFTMWNYKGFIIANKKDTIEKELLTKDKYENDISYLINNFYISINVDQENQYSYPSLFIYDIKNGGKKEMEFDKPLSKNFYYNGEYNNKLYYTDLDNKIQYSLDPLFEVIKEVGNVKDGFLNLVDDELEEMTASKFLANKQIFSNEITDEKIKEKYNAVTIFKNDNSYYYQTKNGEIYRVYTNNLDNPILLVRFSSISEWKVRKDSVIIVSNKYLYYYDNVFGLSLIAENNELIYNYKNICDFSINS